MADTRSSPPVLQHKAYDRPSQFVPENLLREARRQMGLPEGQVPSICVLDPDGDIVASLLDRGEAHEHDSWACYHTTLHRFTLNGIEIGIIRHVVGAPFAVLVAEELFVSGCQLLVHITSSGQIVQKEEPPFFILVEKALRDEGTSYHYLPPSDFSFLKPELLELFTRALSDGDPPVYRGATWTTDAPFRETQAAIQHAEQRGILAVEMEAAALYAFAQARDKAVVCFAHVTNQMGQVEGDFEKGEGAGSRDALRLIAAAAQAWRAAEKVR